MDVKFVSGRGVTWDDSLYDERTQCALTNNYDLGSVEARPWSTTAAGADGDNYYGATMGAREDIFLEYNLIAASASARDTFIKTLKTAFNPYDGLGTLTITLANGDQRCIFCTVKKEPVCLTGWDNRTREFQRVQILLKAYYPFWFDPDLYTQTLASFTGGMSFPLTFPMTFGTTNPSVTITNNGNVATPVVITFTGAVTNPRIDLTNSKYPSGKYIKATMALGAGEYLRINTAQGQHTVSYIVGTTSSNGYAYLDPASEFFMLEPGTNTLSFTQSTAIGSGAACSVEYFEQYIGAL